MASNSKTKTGWKKRQVHEDVTLPSGAKVDIKLPNIGQLIEAGQIPNPLIPIAIEIASKQKLDESVVKDAWEYAKFIVPLTVVSPQISSDDVADLPYEDVEMILAFATRVTDMDAVGKHIGGLHTVQSFRDVRGIFTTDPALLGHDEDGEGPA